MIEKTVLDFLIAAGFTAFLEMPENPPDSFLILEKTGGGAENHICRSTIAVQSYGSSLYAAAQLNERVKAAIPDIAALNEISKISLNSDYNFTDTETKRYRYQAVLDIYHY